jgi:2-C-methyl-D-erythritol 2,4-cyclodiphosphate synthase
VSFHPLSFFICTKKTEVRIGFGFDVHRLKEGRPFRLGGIEIIHPKGAEGHSDADVLIHAICDALLGAANLGDIGKHFPDTSNEFKNIDSKILLKRVCELLKKIIFLLVILIQPFVSKNQKLPHTFRRW